MIVLQARNKYQQSSLSKSLIMPTEVYSEYNTRDFALLRRLRTVRFVRDWEESSDPIPNAVTKEDVLQTGELKEFAGGDTMSLVD